jgi:voltage-gated potassium channel
VSNPLLVFWHQMFGRTAPPRVRLRARIAEPAQASVAIFLIMRRMRAPLITLIVIFSVSVVGLTFMPGVDPDGTPHKLSFFNSFYFMSYTATTIGFGELPHPFTDAQRLWVTISIYMTVIGWAYAIGSLLGLLQDRGFRQALATRRFARHVARLREPFLLLAGFGRTGELLGQQLDALGMQFVVIDSDIDRVDTVDLLPFHADIPGLCGDARNPSHLAIAGLNHPYCSGVLALTNDDETNLAVTMAASLLRPQLPVIARTLSPVIAHRMEAFGTPSIVNPFDRFGDHLRLAIKAPASYQLLTWLEAGPGAELPKRGRPPHHGRWVICGYGRFGKELTADLRAEGLEVTVIEPTQREGQDHTIVVEDASEPGVLARVGLADAVGFVAGTDNDTTNLSLIVGARKVNRRLFIAARQNQPSSAPMFAAVSVDSLLVPTEVVAHEVYAQLVNPLMWRFLQEMPALGDDWAARLIERLVGVSGTHLQSLWKIQLTRRRAPALVAWLKSGDARLGDLLRNPDHREEPLHAIALLVRHGTEITLAPPDDYALRFGDEIMLAGRPGARRALERTMIDDSVREYVLFDRHVPSSWIWRKLARKPVSKALQGSRGST